MANSPCDPIVIPDSWGPLAGDLLLGEMNHERICRAMVQEVRGIRPPSPVIDGDGLRMGNNRLAFAEDGTLWVGTPPWLDGAKGITKITPTGQPYLAFTTCDLTPMVLRCRPRVRWRTKSWPKECSWYVAFATTTTSPTARAARTAMVAATLSVTVMVAVAAQRDSRGLSTSCDRVCPGGRRVGGGVHEPVEGPVPPRPGPTRRRNCVKPKSAEPSFPR